MTPTYGVREAGERGGRWGWGGREERKWGEGGKGMLVRGRGKGEVGEGKRGRRGDGAE